MTMHDVTEARLMRALEMTPSDQGLRRLDERVTRAMARPLPTSRRTSFLPRLVMRPVALLAAFVLLTAAVAGGIGLLGRVVAPVPGWQAAWDRAEVLGLTQADAGVTITLERAYTDLNQIILGLTVVGLGEPPRAADGTPDHFVLSWVTQLRGPNGWTIEDGSPNNGGGMVETGTSAILLSFDRPPAQAGTWELTVTSVGYGAAGGMIDGTWRFEFELPAPSGTTLAPNTSATVGPGTITLTQIQVTPTMAAVNLALEVDGATIVHWGPASWHALAIRHDGTGYDIADGQNPFEGDGAVSVFRTNAGTDAAGGTWEIEIADLWYGNAAGQDVYLDGPFTLTVTVP
jgi:hypothetical protein